MTSLTLLVMTPLGGVLLVYADPGMVRKFIGVAIIAAAILIMILLFALLAVGMPIGFAMAGAGFLGSLLLIDLDPLRRLVIND